MAVAISLLRNVFIAAGLLACSPQQIDVVSGKSCCEDPTQEGCAGAGGVRSTGGSGGNGASAGIGGANTGGSAGAPPVTLLHSYSFQGTGIDVTDAVGNANGNVFGTMLAGTGSVALSDGSVEQYVELPSFILSGLKNATFEAWVTWNGAGAGAWQRIFDFGEDTSGLRGSRGNGRSYLFCTPDDGNGHPKVTFGKPPGRPDETQLIAKTAFPEGEPTHVVVVVDDTGNNSISLFINGGFQGKVDFVDSLDFVYDVNSWLGRSNFVADAGFTGIFHEFRIYSGAMDANQVLDNFQAGLRP